MSNDKVNHNVEPTTFAQPVPEKTELERIQERIANFKVSISPTVAQLAQVLMNQSLQNPTKPEDLDGYVQVRNELKLGLDEYQQQLTNAQSRMAQLQQEHEIAKSTELARKENDLIAARDGERKRRKTAEEKARQLEAVLASHGINIDLDGDGKVGLNVGEETENLTAEQQVTLKKLLDESKAATGGVSRAFEQARAKNPLPPTHPADGGEHFTEDPALAEKVEETKKSFKEWDEYANEASDENGVIASGTTTEEFNEEVAEVESVYDNPAYDEPVTPDYGSKPVISDTNQPDIIEEELAKAEQTESEKMQDELEPIIPPNVRMVEEDDIAEFETPPTTEEETVEVTIPTESELKGMTKSKIQSEALTLGFTGVTTKDSKSKMIENFVTATEKFISDLQDSGEFVSLQEDGEEDENPSDDRDGGYFK
tara:strand:+ start:5212 stop:6492 length:1281 start_codon:yes stop_codon:yes gene_type:complete